MLALRATLNADESAPKISLLALLSRFTVLALRRYPELNARIEGDEIVLNSSVHLGFAGIERLLRDPDQQVGAMGRHTARF